MALNNIPNFGDMKGEMPNVDEIAGGLSMPDCKRTTEYGIHRDDEEFDAVHDCDLSSLEMASMTVLSGAILDGIVVTYADGMSIKHGGNGGTAHKISLQGDSVKRVTGVYNVNFGGRTVISHLGVETKSGKKYGPFGDDKNGSPFTLEGDGEKIVAFFGSTNGAYVASLGGYLMK